MFTLVQKKKQNTQSIEGNILKSQDIFGKYQSDCLKGIAIIMLIAITAFWGHPVIKVRSLFLSYLNQCGIMLLFSLKYVCRFLFLSVHMD